MILLTGIETTDLFEINLSEIITTIIVIPALRDLTIFVVDIFAVGHAPIYPLTIFRFPGTVTF